MASSDPQPALSIVDATERFRSRSIEELRAAAVEILGELDRELLRARLEDREPLPRHVADLVDCTHRALQRHQGRI